MHLRWEYYPSPHGRHSDYWKPPSLTWQDATIAGVTLPPEIFAVVSGAGDAGFLSEVAAGVNNGDSRPFPWEQRQELAGDAPRKDVRFFVLIFAPSTVSLDLDWLALAPSTASRDIDWFALAPLGPDVHLVLPARVGLYFIRLHLLGSELCRF